MSQSVGGGEDIADSIVISQTGMVEGICDAYLPVEGIVGIAGGAI
jgi:hypothetical protein